MLNILERTKNANTPVQRMRMAILMADAAEVDRLIPVRSAT